MAVITEVVNVNCCCKNTCCQPTVLPHTLYATLSIAGCNCIDAITVTLSIVTRCPGVPTSDLWSGSAATNSACYSGKNTVNVDLTCNCSTGVWSITITCTGTGLPFPGQTIDASVTCDPFLATGTFDMSELTSGCCSSGTLTITITE